MVLSSTVSKLGITWSFDTNYEIGQYINGDYWVSGPGGNVTVTSVNPAPSGSGSEKRHGSMLNPIPGIVSGIFAGGQGAQGFDDRAFDYSSVFTVTYPITLTPSQSLVSVESIITYPVTDLIGGVRTVPTQTCIKRGQVLTCVGSQPPSGSFRPAYVGSDKTLYNISSINWDIVPNLSATPNSIDLSLLSGYLSGGIWLDIKKMWPNSLLHPTENVPSYGRDIAYMIAEVGCALCTSGDLERKKDSIYKIIQIGIDLYHTALIASGLWEPDGGYNIGRKFPIVFASKMLNNSSMSSITYRNQEDEGCYYGEDVTPSQALWTGWQNSGHKYASNVLYMLEPGLDTIGNPWYHENYHPSGWDTSPFPNNPASPQYPWDKHDPYRRLVAYALIGQAMVSYAFGLKPLWNHDAYFSYVDRWMNEDDVTCRNIIAAEAASSHIDWVELFGSAVASAMGTPEYYGPFGQTAISTFQKEMYTSFRSLYDDPVTPGPSQQVQTHYIIFKL